RTDQDLVGEWKTVYGKGGWEGFLVFRRDGSSVVWDGHIDRYENEVNKGRIFDLTAGTAHVDEKGNLYLEVDVQDLQHGGDKYRWKSVEPVNQVPAFRGELRTTRDKGDNRSASLTPYGIMMYRWRR